MAADPLAEIVTLLKPAARFSKLVEAGGSWRIERKGGGEPFYLAVLEGSCSVSTDGQSPITLRAGDFVLVPAMRDVVNQSVDASTHRPVTVPRQVGDNHFRIGRPNAPVDLRMRIGHCSFEAPDAALLVPLLPRMVLVRSQARLLTLMNLVGDETRAQRPARDLVLERLLEVLLIEALRGATEVASGPGLSAGLADRRLALALCALHARPEHNWTVADLAAEASMSRSAFFARFSRIVGLPPIEYLLAWRMALAKRLLRERELGMDQVAERVGYGSASAFSTAFARFAGVTPARYARSASA